MSCASIRGKEIAYIFQEPTTSLNPVLTIRTQIGEALALHRPDVSKADRDAEIVRWLDKVGIVQPRSVSVLTRTSSAAACSSAS
jgi:ABC-type dipeptide/oligopeptide/nickel transport system ATPase component